MTPHEVANKIGNGSNVAMVDFNRPWLMRAIEDALITERERCAVIAADFFTLPPKLRTKANLLELIRGTK